MRDIRDSIPEFVELLSINKINRLIRLQYPYLIQFYAFPNGGSVEERKTTMDYCLGHLLW